MALSVSDIGKQLSEQFLLARIRQQVDHVQEQINTGKKSSTFSGLGIPAASNSISYRAERKQIESYISNIDQATARISVMDKSMSSITEIARQIQSDMRAQLQDTTPYNSIYSNSASKHLAQIERFLNSQIGGRYLFAGTDINTPPFASDATLDANMSALVAGWMAGTPTVNSVVSDARGLSGTALGYSTTHIAAGPVEIRVDDNTQTDYTVRADNSGFSDILRGMAIIANLTQPTTAAEQDNYWTIVNAAIELIEDGAQSTDETQGSLGNTHELMKGLRTTHEETIGTLEIFIGKAEDVDLADAVTRFQTLQLQLEASYRVTGEVRKLSLVNFI